MLPRAHPRSGKICGHRTALTTYDLPLVSQFTPTAHAVGSESLATATGADATNQRENPFFPAGPQDVAIRGL